jgi:hypothetical protein
MSIRLVVAHDSDFARLGITSVLNQDHRFEVVGNGLRWRDPSGMGIDAPPFMPQIHITVDTSAWITDLRGNDTARINFTRSGART